jgi:group II intron reverse transcriptase/maturase
MDVLWQAWTDVCFNGGAAGIDGVEIGDVETSGVTRFLEELAEEVKTGTYRPSPLRRVLIPKPGRPGEFRPLSIPTVHDRVVMTAAKLVLEPVFEAGFKPSSHGFRPKRSAHDATEIIRVEVNRHGRRWVLDADIRACFDRIDHDALMARVAKRVSDRSMLKLIQGWLRLGAVDSNGDYHKPAGAGCPQGSPISPLLANIALDAVDDAFETKRAEVGVLVRYADDIVCLCTSRRQAQRARHLLTEILTGFGLELHPDKTGIRDLNRGREGFTFVGFYHRMRRSKRQNHRWVLYRWPGRTATANIKAKIRDITNRRWASAPTEWVVERLNQTLQGWGGYFRHGNSNQVFAGIDSYTHFRLAKLASVKHNQRSRGWQHRYNRDWITTLGVHRLVGTVTYQNPTHAPR